ncbi:MAG: hypothetical protein RR654_02825 [Oscillospiraceae bacterium]
MAYKHNYTYTPDRWRDKYFTDTAPKKPTAAKPKKPKPAKQEAPKKEKPQIDYSAIISAYGSARDAKKQAENEMFSSKKSQLEEAYKASQLRQKEELAATVNMQNGRSNEALRQLYINKELRHRDLPLQMAARGLYGGAEKASTLNIDSGYELARGEAEAQHKNTLNLLQNNANLKLQSEKEAYEKQRQSLESAYAKAIQDMETEYAKLVAKLNR